MYRALERLPAIPDPMPAELIDAEALDRLRPARSGEIHFPEDAAGSSPRAIERLKFDELFTLELGVAFRKHRVEAESRRRARAGRRADSTGCCADAAVRADRGPARAIDESTRRWRALGR